MPSWRCLSLALALTPACGGEEFGEAASGGTGALTGGTAGQPAGGAAGSGGSVATGGSGGQAGSGASGGSAGGGTGGAGGGCTATNLTTDPKNCGECGHDCLGSECASGRCKPAELATGIKPVGIALGTNAIYFADDGAQAIRVMSKSGGPVSDFSAGQQQPYYVAFDAGTLYWTKADQGSLMKKATGAAPVALASGMQTPLGVAIWAGVAHVAEAGTGRVVKVPTDGSTKGLLTTLPASQFIEGLATDGTKLWVSYNSTDTIVELPITGGTELPFVQGQGKPAGIAVDADFVYWVNQSTGELRKKRKTGGQVVTLAVNLQLPVGVAVDAQWAYFSENQGQRISRVAK